MEIRQNINKIKAQIETAIKKRGNSFSLNDIKIVAVSKFASVSQILEAIESGIEIVGESRVQEAKKKQSEIGFLTNKPEWHLIGHLQKNKVKEAVRLFEIIHSVDNIEIAKEIDKWAANINKIQQVLIQVNISGEKTKFGISYSEVQNLIKQINLLHNIRIQGLMTIAPLVDDPEDARQYFRLLFQIREEFRTIADLKYLSMGMTDDFEIAIEEGSNMVRIGRAIFSR